jgi:hypothetical protein
MMGLPVHDCPPFRLRIVASGMTAFTRPSAPRGLPRGAKSPGRAEGPGCAASVDLSLIEIVAGLWCTLRRLSGQIRRIEVILHIDDPDPLDPRPWRFDPEQARGLAERDAAPELLLRGQEEVLVKRIGGNRDLNPFAAAGDDREGRHPRVGRRNEFRDRWGAGGRATHVAAGRPGAWLPPAPQRKTSKSAASFQA